MKTIKDVFTEYKKGLEKIYNLNEIEAITLLVINDICKLSKAKIKAFPEQELSLPQYEKLDDILIQLQTGKPVQYILGKTEFYGLPFIVNPSVLIPRPETEELVEWVVSEAKSTNTEAGRILDIGTGSGCIAIALKTSLAGFDISAIDISQEALKTAADNAVLNNVSINFIKDDILNLKSGTEIPRSEIIVSNPPYVTMQDKTQMHTNVTDFEPHTALFVPENDPLLFYKAIANFAMLNLNANGLLFFEINESYGKQIVELLKDKGFINIQLKKDMSGRDRMVRAVK